MSEGGKEAVRADDEVVARADLLALQKRVRGAQAGSRQEDLGE